MVPFFPFYSGVSLLIKTDYSEAGYFIIKGFLWKFKYLLLSSYILVRHLQEEPSCFTILEDAFELDKWLTSPVPTWPRVCIKPLSSLFFVLEQAPNRH